MLVYAEDAGIPVKRRSDPAMVTITVIRNKFSPQFSREYRRTGLRQDADPGTGVIEVSANDQDDRVSLGRSLLSSNVSNVTRNCFKSSLDCHSNEIVTLFRILVICLARGGNTVIGLQ